MIDCTICIIGAGTAGMAAAYALRNQRGISVVIVEPYEQLGGTAVNAWVQTWAEGITPLYLKDIFRRCGYSDEKIANSVLPVRYSGIEGGNLFIYKDELSKIYYSDMKVTGNIKVLTNHSFVRVKEVENGRIKTIVVKSQNTRSDICISADFFIDSSGDGVLCRSACPIEGEDYFVGEDSFDRFKEPLMKNRKWDRNVMNEPSLFYGVGDNVGSDEEMLKPFGKIKIVGEKVEKPNYINHDGSTYGSYINPMTGMGIDGVDILHNYDQKYEEAKNKRQFEHWKYVKLNLELQSNLGKSDDTTWASYLIAQRKWNHTGLCAPMLGIRESYRIHCERMLTQNDLKERINRGDLKDFIACGTETVDLHIYGNIDPMAVLKFNEQVQPTGIPYSCLVPRKLKNVLVACRAFGASHIALAARRVNRDMAQLGWAAGNALRICCEQDLHDVRRVSEFIKELQGTDYTGFAEAVENMCGKFKK